MFGYFFLQKENIKLCKESKEKTKTWWKNVKKLYWAIIERQNDEENLRNTKKFLFLVSKKIEKAKLVAL